MAKRIEVTYSLAMAAGHDAGNRSMRAGGRTKWAVRDWNAACETFAKLWPEPTTEELASDHTISRLTVGREEKT
jgi:hypothetical protein